MSTSSENRPTSAFRPASLTRAQVISTLGVGAAIPNQELLQWGRNPRVAQALKKSVRRVADRLRQEGDWGTLSDLVREMTSGRGAGEAERILGVEIGQVRFRLDMCVFLCVCLYVCFLCGVHSRCRILNEGLNGHRKGSKGEEGRAEGGGGVHS